MTRLLGFLLVLGIVGCGKSTPQDVTEQATNEDVVLPTFEVVAQGGATCALKGMTAPTRKVVIPETIDGMKVTQIDNFSSLLNAKKGARGWSFTHSGTGFKFGGDGGGMAPTNDITEEIVIPGSVQHIASNAFRYCKNLKKVTFSEGLITIGSAAFEHCAELESVEFPSSLREIEASAFERCGALHTVVFQEGFETLGESAFSRCSLTEITFPKSFKALGGGVFYHCLGLKRVIFLGDKPSGGLVGNRTPSVVYYDPQTKGWDEPGGPAGRAQIGVPASRKTISEIHIKGTVFDYAFKNDGAVICRWNQSGAVVIPETVDGVPVTVIGDHAFQGNEMTEVALPDTIREIHFRAFEGCANLVHVKLPAELEFLGGYAFAGCTEVTVLDLPPKLSHIGSSAFSGTGIESLVIPANVTYVGQQAFDYNKHLKRVLFLGDLPRCSRGRPHPGRWLFSYGGKSPKSNATVYFCPDKQGWDRVNSIDSFFGQPTQPYQASLGNAAESPPEPR